MSKQECPQQQESVNGQVQPQQKADPMKVISAITLDELTDILVNLVEDDELDFEYKVNGESDAQFASIACTIGDLDFWILPIGDGPFYEEFMLSKTFDSHLDPEVLCVEFNGSQKFASATPVTVQMNEDSDDEDEVIVEVEKMVLLHGGVTVAHIRAIIRLWCGMLLSNQEFFEGPTVDATDGDEPE